MAAHSSARLESPMDRGAWRAAIHGVAQSRTQQSDQHFHLQMSLASLLYKHQKPKYRNLNSCRLNHECFSTLSYVEVIQIFSDVREI